MNLLEFSLSSYLDKLASLKLQRKLDAEERAIWDACVVAEIQHRGWDADDAADNADRMLEYRRKTFKSSAGT